ncbi:hypothetical protein [Paraburkholderia sp. BCC1884]|nr:hypothetical protein [Paraburkholderia sp. BCC1884]
MMSTPIAPFDDAAMTYPYDMLTAACLFIIVVSTTIMLALN